MKNNYDLKLIISFMLGFFLTFWLVVTCSVFTDKTSQLEIREIHYLEVPCLLGSINDITFCTTEEEIYEKYMSQLTNNNREEWWYGYKYMKNTLTVPPLSITDVYTEEELMYLYQCVETEVYGASFDARVNVANVVLNRVNSDKFGNTIKEVVTSPNQFAYFRTDISQMTIEACAYAFEIEDTTDGALFFHSGAKTDTFNSAQYIFTDDAGHHFYK